MKNYGLEEVRALEFDGARFRDEGDNRGGSGLVMTMSQSTRTTQAPKVIGPRWQEGGVERGGDGWDE